MDNFCGNGNCNDPWCTCIWNVDVLVYRLIINYSDYVHVTIACVSCVTRTFSYCVYNVLYGSMFGW